MKERRHGAILEIVDNYDIETQEELAKQLLNRGFKVTQATISRDIKELHLIKIQTETGVYKYAINESSNVLNTERLLRIFRETVLNIQCAGNLIVVNTLTGSANAAAEFIDNLELEGVLGSIAGDNTIFIAADTRHAEPIAAHLKQLAK